MGVLYLNYFINISNLDISVDDKNFIKERANMERCIIAIVVVFLTFQWFGFYRIYKDKYITNYADKYRCEQIGEAIEKYENESGNKIKNIAFYYDMNSSIQYKDLYQRGDVIRSSFTAVWSQLTAINYYLGTDYSKAGQNEAYAAEFQSKNWNYFS